MKTEKSCGAVVFTRENGGIKYVIIESKSGVYGFPKGHIEKGESEEQTAMREILEETALSVTIVGDFRLEESYTFSRGGKTIRKINVYFLAEYLEGTPIAQESELRGVYIWDYKTALSRFQFDSSKRILTEAHNYLAQS